jgi:hypothetical protein
MDLCWRSLFRVHLGIARFAIQRITIHQRVQALPAAASPSYVCDNDTYQEHNMVFTFLSNANYARCASLLQTVPDTLVVGFPVYGD